MPSAFDLDLKSDMTFLYMGDLFKLVFELRVGAISQFGILRYV